MGRFLIFFSYVGCSFRGMQRQLVAGIPREGTKTVQSSLEAALQSLRPANEVKVVSSSRTDAGVHALCNSVHVDLVHRNADQEYEPELLTGIVNKILHRRKEPLTILQMRRVSDDFHARFRAVARHYLYRIAVVKEPMNIHWANPLSALESKRCHMVIQPFDVEKLHQAGRVFAGTHDFSAFTNASVLKDDNINPVKSVSVGVKSGELFLRDYQGHMHRHTDIWEIHVSSQSFLFKQVRRMVGAMIRVAEGKNTVHDIEDALNNPHEHILRDYMTCKVCHHVVPPHGLYLKDVEYDMKDLECSPSDMSEEREFDMDIESLKQMINAVHAEDYSVTESSAQSDTEIIETDEAFPDSSHEEQKSRNKISNLHSNAAR